MLYCSPGSVIVVISPSNSGSKFDFTEVSTEATIVLGVAIAGDAGSGLGVAWEEGGGRGGWLF
jgi:hypothetical protein